MDGHRFHRPVVWIMDLTSMPFVADLPLRYKDAIFLIIFFKMSGSSRWNPKVAGGILRFQGQNLRLLRFTGYIHVISWGALL